MMLHGLDADKRPCSYFTVTMQENCFCEDACNSVGFSSDDSTSSFAEISVDYLLDHDQEGILEKYMEAREMRERAEPERLQRFLLKQIETSANLQKYLVQTRFVASDDATSVKTLSEQIIHDFVKLVEEDINTMFDDIDTYLKVYEKLLGTMRWQIQSSLDKFLASHSYLLRVYSLLLYNNEGAAAYRETEHVPGQVVQDLTELETTLESFTKLELGIVDFFYRGANAGVEPNGVNYEPTRLYPDRDMEDSCKKKKAYNTTKLRSALEALQNITDETVSGQLVSFFGEMLSRTVQLQESGRDLENEAEDIRTCLNYYKNFLTLVSEFRKNHAFSATNGPNLHPDITFNLEIAQQRLIHEWHQLEIIESEIALHTKEKIEVAKEMNETFIAEIENELESLRVAVNDEVLNKIGTSLDLIRKEALDVYNSALLHLEQMEKFFAAVQGRPATDRFEQKAKGINIWLQVSSGFSQGGIFRQRLPRPVNPDLVWPLQICQHSQTNSQMFNAMAMFCFDLFSFPLQHPLQPETRIHVSNENSKVAGVSCTEIIWTTYLCHQK